MSYQMSFKCHIKCNYQMSLSDFISVFISDVISDGISDVIIRCHYQIFCQMLYPMSYQMSPPDVIIKYYTQCHIRCGISSAWMHQLQVVTMLRDYDIHANHALSFRHGIYSVWLLTRGWVLPRLPEPLHDQTETCVHL